MPTKNQQDQWRRADDEVRKNLPPGVKLVRTLRGHTGWIGRIAWSPDGRMLASPSQDKTIRLWDAELDYARALQGNTGHPQVKIRAGIHIGPMHVDEGDVFGGAVNFAARVVGTIRGEEIWLSDSAKRDSTNSAPRSTVGWNGNGTRASP